ncbi:MAG TPA: PLP-dependent aminotransferase family protein [Thermoanaerobaculia bacterium]|nr:PLP-dependent aminotransferase family protein [Thermoanaerobaculia bacterium]
MKAVSFVVLLGPWRAAVGGPLYRRLAVAAVHAVVSGRLPVGARLPAERALAAALAVSRTTVVGAYDVLREEGWVESRRGSGTRVRAAAGDASAGAAAGEGAAGGAGASVAAGAGAHAAAGAVAAAAGAGAAGAAGGGGELTRPLRRMDFFRGLVEASGSRIDFLGAHLPAAQPFLAEEWNAAAADLAAQLGHHGYLGLGLPALRAAIAAHLTAAGLPTAEEQVLVTSGAQQAIGLVAALYLQPGDAVALEDPNYPGAIDIFNHARARLVPIPVTAEGAHVERLREAVARESPRLIYLVPSFHNPTGALMPEAHRRIVARLAADTGTPVLEDLTLADLDLDVPPPPPIAAAAPGAPVVTVGSLSKLVWAGLRIGWVRAEAPVVARLARFKVLSDLGSSLPSQVLAARLLRRAAAIREARRQEARERRRALEQALAAALPDWTWRRPAGGLCLWVRLPRGNAEELARHALRHGVAIVPGPTCSPRDAWENYLRLPFVLAQGELNEGIARLARAWEA